MDNVRRERLITAYKKAMSRLDMATAFGYSCSGRVIQVNEGADEFQVGDRVACAGAPYANYAEVLEGILPKAIIRRCKAAFGVPFRAWLRRDLGPMLADPLSPEAIRRRGYFSALAV